MDPNAALADIVYAFRTSEWAECVNHCNDLIGWLKKGGFSPTTPGPEGPMSFNSQDLIGFCRITRRICTSEIERAAG